MRNGVFMTVSECMDKAKKYMEQLTICSEHNVPERIVADEHAFFTWDNELRTPSLKPYLFDWSYYNGVVMEGLLDIYETDKVKYVRLHDYVKEYLDAMITEDEKGHPVLDRNKAGYVDHHGVDCYKSAMLLEKMTDGKDVYAAIADDLYRDLTSDTYVNSHGDIVSVKYTEEALGGNYWHGWAGGNPPKYKVWLDGIYMIQPFITAHAGRVGGHAQLEKGVRRFEWVATELLSPQGIYYHAGNGRDDVCDFHWLRATGWYGMAMADVLELLPEEMSVGIRKAVKLFVDGMLKIQDESGMWANLADRPVTATNRLETSGTAMMVYTILKAVRLGALDEEYRDKAVKAFCALAEQKLRDGKLEDIYMKAAADGTNNYEDPEYYMPDEGKGSGPFLMAYAEMLLFGC